jgi:hypothetical protein
MKRGKQQLDPEDFPLRESRVVTAASIDLQAIVNSDSDPDDDVLAQDDEDGAASLRRLNSLSKRVSRYPLPPFPRSTPSLFPSHHASLRDPPLATFVCHVPSMRDNVVGGGCSWHRRSQCERRFSTARC